MRISRGMINKGISIALLLALTSCGGVGTSNDQGASFLATGYFADTTGDTGEVGAIWPLHGDTQNQVGSPNMIITALGLQNFLSKQFINVQRIDCDYDVQGASAGFTVPTESNSVALHLTSAPTEDSESIGYVEFLILTPDIIQYLNVNRNSLPELPFMVTATCTAIGITQAGDVIETNAVNYLVEFFEFPECCTGDGVNGGGGFQAGPGTGGDLDTFDSAQPAADV